MRQSPRNGPPGIDLPDSCLVIYLVERHPVWSDVLASGIAAATEQRFAVSPLVKLECLVGPFQRGDPIPRQAYTGVFAELITLEMPDAVYVRAAELRARFGLRTPDALHLACAQHHGCDSLWTNDDRLATASQGFARRLTSS